MFSGEPALVVGTRIILSWLGGISYGYAMIDGTLLASYFMHAINNLVSHFLFPISRSLPYVEGIFVLYYCWFFIERFLFQCKRTKNEYVVSYKHYKMHLTCRELT